ncbi:hypothetical protein K5D34_17510 [Pseudomonas cichorii]|uniref:hypothetical protein n=1 Tax=Pseudomonas cichorii TaxID=36746 RepID=UPI0019105232|nr:hypothetical protein [Pseudomonas cichorii]MBX8511488.1 hypothetical protein [Pseudomonas cichorii]MBX8526459.1 hypothetical protein [Pseudomonas cichorii]MBX8590214.1 hypothetical protein [Pseudomonas cichorii]GFM66555.1 hypothetical protein PSCICJ_26730 [Pseudomonas cichorii]
MDSTKPQDDDGIIRIQRLVPGQVDVVLGSHPGKQRIVKPRKSSRGYVLAFLFLGIFVVLAVGLSTRTSTPKPAPLIALEQPEPETAPEPVDEAPVQVANELARPALRVEPYVVPTPVAATQESAPVAQPLDNCIKDGNVIDESVLNCRFGQASRPAQAAPATGMVSASYMADFKSDASRKAPARQQKPHTVATVSIREWDGNGRYRAQWRLYENRIDGDSVCENFLNRSVERRECRLSAQVFFKEECREWNKRAARDRNEESKNTAQRYCEAMTTFTP